MSLASNENTTEASETISLCHGHLSEAVTPRMNRKWPHSYPMPSLRCSRNDSRLRFFTHLSDKGRSPALLLPRLAWWLILRYNCTGLTSNNMMSSIVSFNSELPRLALEALIAQAPLHYPSRIRVPSSHNVARA